MVDDDKPEKHLCIGDMNPPAYIKYLSLTRHLIWKASSVFMSATQVGLCFCTLEQNRPYQCLVGLQVYFGADTA